MGEMLTPPQLAPKDNPQGGSSEMSFRDLVDDSDEEEQEGRKPRPEKLNASGQVLVDPEDLQVVSQLPYFQKLHSLTTMLAIRRLHRPTT